MPGGTIIAPAFLAYATCLTGRAALGRFGRRMRTGLESDAIALCYYRKDLAAFLSGDYNQVTWMWMKACYLM